MNITCCRFHDFSAGHRVVGHEGKCRYLHGHNYRVHFTVKSLDLDSVGRVVDFSVIKNYLCEWLEENWDHKFLLWEEDHCRHGLLSYDGIVLVPFNPTAENMAFHLLDCICPKLFNGLPYWVTEVTVEETTKCSATARITDGLPG